MIPELNARWSKMHSHFNMNTNSPIRAATIQLLFWMAYGVGRSDSEIPARTAWEFTILSKGPRDLSGSQLLGICVLPLYRTVVQIRFEDASHDSRAAFWCAELQFLHTFVQRVF